MDRLSNHLWPSSHLNIFVSFLSVSFFLLSLHLVAGFSFYPTIFCFNLSSYYSYNLSSIFVFYHPPFFLDFLVILPHHVYVLLSNFPLAVQCYLSFAPFGCPSSVPFPSLFYFIISFIFSILHPSYPHLCPLQASPTSRTFLVFPSPSPYPPLLSPITNDHLHAC